jgi:hypothetical protein
MRIVINSQTLIAKQQVSASAGARSFRHSE